MSWKRKTAKELLAESFRELAQTKSVDKITIQDITDNCGYSPATFYRHFKDKYDLIAWDHTRGVEAIMGQTAEKELTWKQSLIEGANWLFREKGYLVNLLKHTSGHDSFILYMANINFNALKNKILRAAKKDTLSQQEEIYVRIYCLGTVSLTCEWLLGKYSITPGEIAELYDNSLPAPLKKYLSERDE